MIQKIQKMSASEFVDTRLRLYSAHSNVRGIPFIGDGFKQSHRKATWGMMERGENADKDTVERIAARSASVTDYAHGVGSLEGTIVGMTRYDSCTRNQRSCTRSQDMSRPDRMRAVDSR